MFRRLTFPLKTELIHLFWRKMTVIQDVEHSLTVVSMHQFKPCAPVPYFDLLAYVLIRNLEILFLFKPFCQGQGG